MATSRRRCFWTRKDRNPRVHWEDDRKLPPVEPGKDYCATTAIADHAAKCLKEHAQKHSDKTVLSLSRIHSAAFPALSLCRTCPRIVDLVEYGKISTKTDRVIGVFLDCENYWPSGPGNLYQITYEDAVLKPFLNAKGADLPRLEPGATKSWLEEHVPRVS